MFGGNAMTDSDFATIQKSLGVIVPAVYRRIMSVYPFFEARPSDAYIPDNAEFVCSLNQQIRTDDVYGDLWRPSFFAVGTSWNGDAHVLDTSLLDSPVLLFSQENLSVTTIAPMLDDWVSTLSRWYVDFDSEHIAAEYSDTTSAIQAAGYFATRPEPMDGWHRITISSRRGGGNSFWIAVIKGNWFAGAWGGNIYRILGNAADFCVSWLKGAPNLTRPDFSSDIQTQFGLESVSDAEFVELTRAT